MEKINKKECTVGYKCWYESNPNCVWFEQGCTENGWCFKDDEAFKSKETAVCYIPENDDYWDELEKDFKGTVEATDGNTVTCGYTYQDILDVCDGVPHLAECIYNEVDWQCPETLLNEWCDSDTIEDCFFNVADDMTPKLAEYLASIYDEDKYGSDWSDYYKFYITHALKNLVHHRYSSKDLAKELGNILGVEVNKVDDTTASIEDEDLEYDYCITVSNDAVIVDIYYLLTRNGKYYITEVGYDFDGVI